MDKSWDMSKGDHRCCLFLPHNKVEYKHLSRAMVWHTSGAPFYGIMSSYPGGLSGGPAQSAVVGVAEWILGKLLFDIPINGSWSVDAMYFSNTSKTALWCNNWQNAAVSKNVVLVVLKRFETFIREPTYMPCSSTPSSTASPSPTARPSTPTTATSTPTSSRPSRPGPAPRT